MSISTIPQSKIPEEQIVANAQFAESLNSANFDLREALTACENANEEARPVKSIIAEETLLELVDTPSVLPESFADMPLDDIPPKLPESFDSERFFADLRSLVAELRRMGYRLEEDDSSAQSSNETGGERLQQAYLAGRNDAIDEFKQQSLLFAPVSEPTKRSAGKFLESIALGFWDKPDPLVD